MHAASCLCRLPVSDFRTSNPELAHNPAGAAAGTSTCTSWSRWRCSLPRWSSTTRSSRCA